MMNLLVRRKCCCAGAPVKQWTASVCTSGSCVRTCAGSIATCIPTITFCDSYRQTIGLPDALDPTKCYIMVLGGCLYVVNDFTYVSTCDSTPTSTRNIGTLYGTYDKPVGLGCDTLCASLQSIHTYGPEVWIGGIACGTDIVLTYPWTNARCSNVGGEECSATPFDPCPKTVGTIATTHNLGSFPVGFAWPPTQCSPEIANCVDCIYQNSNPQSNSWYFNEQISSNYCGSSNPFGICVTPSCSLSEQFNSSIQSTDPSLWTYSVGFSITRSCAYPFGDGTGWVSGGPDSNYITIDNCLFGLNTGCRSSTLATKINDVLGQASQVGSTTFTATGTNAWIGQACNAIPGADCDSCLSSPYSWSGPYYTNSGRTATWYAAPILTYIFNSTLSARNFSRNGSDGCGCTGSDFGGIIGYYVSTNQTSGIISGPVIEYGSSLTGASFAMTDDPGASNPPCCPAPTMS